MKNTKRSTKIYTSKYTNSLSLAERSCSPPKSKNIYNVCVTNSFTWWLIGRFVAFRPKGRGFEFRSNRHIGTLGKSFTRRCLCRFGLKLRYSVRAVSGAPLGSSFVLCRSLSLFILKTWLAKRSHLQDN